LRIREYLVDPGEQEDLRVIKKEGKLRNKEEYPVSYCPVCKEKVVVNISTFTHKKSKIRVDVISCPLCDMCINVDRIPDIEWWDTEKIEKELDWKIENEDLRVIRKGGKIENTKGD